MKCLVFICFLFSIFEAAAQTPSVVPLFRNDSLRTHVTMPFRLLNHLSQPLPILNLELITGQGNCRAMVDPHISSNFLVKCQEPSDIEVSVYFKSNDEVTRINYGPIPITALSTSGVVQPITDDTNRYAKGRNLFNTHCLSCHQNPHEKPNRSFTQLKSALNNIGQMKSIRLTDDEIREISAYLNNLD